VSTDTNTGGPAFPSTFHNGWGEPEKGMTLRDYFAAKAMQGLLAGTTTSNGSMIVKDAYAIADGMLKAREA
jgi:hypothetical protein